MEKTITALEVQKNNPERINVFLDETFAFGVSRFIALGLKVGQKLNQKGIEELSDRDNREKAYQYALRFIGYKPRTSYELVEKLKVKDIPDFIISSILDEFKEKKYIDDLNFATQWVETRISAHPRSRRMLRHELKQKGIQENEIDLALENAPEDIDLAMELALKNQHKYASLDDDGFKKKMCGLLTRKAFNYSDIQFVVEKLLKSKQENETE